MKKTLLLLTLLLMAGAELQSQSWQWAKRIGGGFGPSQDTPNESVRDVQTDAQGNVYICGRVCFGANFNGTPMTTYSTLGYTLFLAKLDCNGNLLWLRTAGGDLASNLANSLTLDGLGHIYLTGRLDGTTLQPVSFLDTTINVWTRSVFLAKLDTSGNLIWIKIANDPPNVAGSEGRHVRMNYDGKIKVAISSGIGKLFPGYSIAAPSWLIIATFDTSGNITDWDNIGEINISYTPINDYAIHPVTGDQYVTGDFTSDSLVIGNGDTVLYNVASGGTHNCLFVAKFNSSGNFNWAYRFGHTYFMKGFGLSFLSNNNILLTGSASNGVIINNDTLVNPLYATSSFPFVMCFTPSGQILWARNIQVQNYVSQPTAGITTLNNQNSVFGAFFALKAVINNDTLIGSGLKDILMASVSPTGIISNGVLLACTGSKEEPLCITSDSSGNVYIGGGFDGTMTVNGVNYVSAGGQSDGFIAKYGFNCTTGIEEETLAAQQHDGLHIYPNPASNVIYISNTTGEIEKAELYNLLGEKVIAQRVTRSHSRLSMNTATLPSGIYLVAVYKKNGERLSAKVMVQRE